MLLNGTFELIKSVEHAEITATEVAMVINRSSVILRLCVVVVFILQFIVITPYGCAIHVSTGVMLRLERLFLQSG